MGEAVLQVQTHANLTLDDSAMRGDCTADACTNAAATYDVAADAAAVNLAWADFTGGAPETTVTTSQIWGLQFQFHCEADAACAVDVEIDDLQFY
jgi:hypothetical protein